MSKHPVPDAAHVKDLLGFLFDGLAVKPAPKLDISPTSGNFLAVYIADDGSPVALCACNVAFAANAGAALSMLPPTAAKEAAKNKVLTPAKNDNLREVMNICSRLMLRDGSAHLRLDRVYQANALPPPAAALVSSTTGRVDLEVTLGKYGPGALSVLVV
jgi:hypothetical protein